MYVSHTMDGRTAWIWFIVSLSSLILGLAVVLTSMVRLVVPTMEQHALSHTQCIIHTITTSCTSVECTGIEKGCVQVEVLYRLPGSGITTSGYLFPVQKRTNKHHDSRLELQNQCFCEGCLHNSTEVLLSHWDRPLKLGELIRCSYHMSHIMSEHSTTATEAYPDTWRLLHALLWPTLLFICGFVGVFFSCVLLAQEQWRWARRIKGSQFKMTVTSPSQLL